MKKMNDGEIQANVLVKSGNEKATGNDTTVSNLNDRSNEQRSPATAKRAQVNKDEDDLMNRSDFRYFYSGRKLL